MTAKLLLVATISYALILGVAFGWRRNLRSFVFWSFMGAALVEIAASQLGLNRGFSDTLLKQLLAIFGLGFPTYGVARHAGVWKSACANASSDKNGRTALRVAIHLAPLLNLAMPGLSLLVTGLAYVIAMGQLRSLKQELVDSVWFQATWSLLLFASYVLSAMPVGIYMSGVVILLGLGRICVGLAVISRGYNYAYYQRSPAVLFDLKRILNKNGLTNGNKDL